MEQYEKRLVAEYNALNEKTEKLESFILGGIFEELESIDKELLTFQYATMKSYRDVLGIRIHRATKGKC